MLNEQPLEAHPHPTHFAAVIAGTLFWLTAVGVTFAAWVDVEYIVGGFPALVLGGSLIIVLAMRRNSWALLCYALSSLWCVALLCLLIAVFDMSPADARVVVPVLLTAYLLLLACATPFASRRLFQRPKVCRQRPRNFQFNVRGMLIVTTVVCVTSALGRIVSSQNDVWIFGSGGFALLGISGLIAWWFAAQRE